MDEYPVRDRAFRPGAADLEAARHRVVPPVLPPAGEPLRVLFCGINPGLYTAATGWHFARPGNRFWPALHGAGFTATLLHPSEQGVLAAAGDGITNLVSRPTARADELSAAELVEGGRRLEALAAATRPAFVAVVGIGAYRVAFARPRAAIGPQEHRIGPAAVWVLPNPSGLNAHYPLPKIIDEFARLAVAASSPSAVYGGSRE